MLLVVATGIWGVIVVRLINLTDAPRLTSVEPIRHEDEMSGLKDTLLLNYRDPFLGSSPCVSHGGVSPIVYFARENPERRKGFSFGGVRRGKSVDYTH